MLQILYVILKEGYNMAEKSKKQQSKSGFNAPVYGTVHAKGSKIKKNPDGTISIIEPKKKK